jgi:hypothetical protein
MGEAKTGSICLLLSFEEICMKMATGNTTLRCWNHDAAEC